MAYYRKNLFNIKTEIKNIVLILSSFACFIHLSFPQSSIRQKLDSLEIIESNNQKIEFLLSFIEIPTQESTDIAISLCNKLIDLSLQEGNTLGLAVGCLQKARLLFEQGSYIGAVELYEESLRQYQAINDKIGMAKAYKGIGSLYFTQEEYDNAREYFLASINLYDPIDNRKEIAGTLSNIGAIFLMEGEIDSSLDYFMIALRTFEDLEDMSSIIDICINIGNSYIQKSLMDSAEFYFEKSLTSSHQLSSPGQIVDAYYQLGNLYNAFGDYNTAVAYFDSALLYDESVLTLLLEHDITDGLYTAYYGLGNEKAALEYLQKLNVLKDSLTDQRISQELARLRFEQQFQIERQEQEKKIIRARLFRNFSLITVGLLLGISFFIFRSYRNKQKANKLLAEMDELKSRLFSNISHEFRTPLTLILGPLEEMLDEQARKSPTHKTVQMMQRNANRLLDLVNQMLDLSKVDAGSMKLELAEADLLKALRVLLSSFSSLADKKEIQFKQIIPEGSLITWFDQDKIEKIITNLLSNAFKFTPEGGKVICEVVPASNRKSITISVTDTGKGIAPDQLQKIFDRFHQVEKPNDPERIGTGIGLALTKELVDLMHGEIKVESTVGEGTSFTVSLPVGKDHLEHSEYSTVESQDDRETHKVDITVESPDQPCVDNLDDEILEGSTLPIVLTVEDHADIRNHIREHLEDSFRVIEASDGEMGLNKAIECIPDLVITDLMMPRMDGVEMCKKLKTDERTSHIPVIMLTAKAGVEDRIEGLETGADAYVTKPFHIKELRIRVKKLIEQRQLLRERFSKDIKLEPKDIAVTSADETFLNRALEIIEEHMSDSEFEVRNFQDELGMSRMQLFRKLKALTDQSPSEFIRIIRLKRAARLMEQQYGNVAQITYEVGFNNLSYFAKCFKELFGDSPSEYMKKHKQ